MRSILTRITLFIFLSLSATLASATPVCIPPLTFTNSDFRTLTKRDIAVDYNMGLVQFVGYDKTHDIGKVFIIDDAYARRLYSDKGEREELAGQAIYLDDFSNRRIAKVGTRASSRVIRSRINDFFGFRNVTLYFGLYPVLQRLRPRSQFALKTQYLNVIRKHYSEKHYPDLDALISHFQQAIFRRYKNDDTSELDQIGNMLIELSAVTGENLFHTGILATFARDRIDNWTWPIRTGPYAFNSPTLGSVNVRFGVPRDIDHYARSWAWGAVKIRYRTPAASGGVGLRFVVQNQFLPNWLVLVGNANELVSLVPNKDMPEFFRAYTQLDPFWLRIYEVSGAVRFSREQLRLMKGQNISFSLSDPDQQRARRIADELRRVAYDNGALSVSFL